MNIPDTDLYYPPPRLYCGPTALSAITGMPYEGCIRPAINQLRGRRANAGVTGMKNAEMLLTLGHFGRLALPLDGFWRYGLRVRLPEVLRYVFAQNTAQPSDIIVVETTRHYVTVQNNVVVDNHMIDSLIRHPARRQLAKRAWQIVSNPQWHMVEVRRAA